MIQREDIQPIRIKENIEEYENNETETKKNINKENNEDTTIMRLKSEEILYTLYMKHMKERMRSSDEAKKRSSKRQDWQSKENVGEDSNNNICTVGDAVYATGKLQQLFTCSFVWPFDAVFSVSKGLKNSENS